MSDSKTHSERPACIKGSGRYYIVFALSGIVLIIIYSLRLVIIEIALLSKGVS